MAKEALGLYFDENLDNVKKPSTCKEVQALFPNELVMLVGCNPARVTSEKKLADSYAKLHDISLAEAFKKSLFEK